ncbi:MAG: hypothetical protein FJX25_05835 [Alphaproteobacteria bacterium]|nr:hypothetical protein [Alphaproteobacteria bacterium]
MPSVETEIWEALRTRIKALPLPLPIAMPGSIYELGDGEWLAVGRATQPPRRILIAGGPHERIGTLTLAHCAPLGRDSSWYEQRAGLIAAHFPEDLLLPFGSVTVRVREAPHVQDGYRDGGWWRTPVAIRWACFA